MSIILYGAPLSPFVRKTRIALALKNLDYQLEVILPFATPESYKEINPLRRVPALRDGETLLADSSVICHYLDDAYPETYPLLPSEPSSRAKCFWFEKFADYELAPLTTFTVFAERLLKPMRGEMVDEEKIAEALIKLEPLFDYLEEQLQGKTWLVDGRYTLADFAIYCQLINFEYANEQPNQEKWPLLFQHFQRCKAEATSGDVKPLEDKMLSKVKSAAQGNS